LISWASFIAAFVACGLALSVLIRWAQNAGFVDHPNGRKDHSHPVPVVGGVGALAGLIAGFWVAGDGTLATAGVLGAATLLVVVGLIDDLRDVHWLPRILAQIVASVVLIVVSDVVLLRLGQLNAPVDLHLGLLAVPFTVFAIVGLINAVNMVDGLDGLAGTLSLSSLVLMAVFARLSGNAGLGSDLLACTGAVTGFLLFNVRFPGRVRAHTFLGNGGSALLGMLLAWAAIRLSHEGTSPMTPALAPWLVAVPILDCLGLIARRVRLGRSPFSADRAHLHHLLLDRGMTVNQVIMACLGLHLSLAGVGIALHYAGTPDWALIVGFIAVLAVYLQVTVRLGQASEGPELVEVSTAQ
jgi:UDP-GlcNAc:undecaprenyl-phosphate GlcNAc-1-phosphate transferase